MPAQNLAKHSRDQGNAAWVSAFGAGMTFTSNNVAAPDGTMTATKCDFAVTTSYFYQASPNPSFNRGGIPFTFSIWLYSPSKATIGLRMFDGAAGVTATATVNLTTGWRRYSVTMVTTAASIAVGTNFINFGVENRAGLGGDGLAGTVYTWEGQLEKSNAAGDPVQTTTAVVDTGAPPNKRLGQNFMLQSENVQNASWIKSAGTTATTPSADVPPPIVGMVVSKVVCDGSIGAGGNAFYQPPPTSLTSPAGRSAVTSFWARTASGTASLRLGNGITYTLLAVTTTWIRFSHVWVGDGVNIPYFAIYLPAGGTTPFTIYVTALQEEIGDAMGDYIQTTTVAIP